MKPTCIVLIVLLACAVVPCAWSQESQTKVQQDTEVKTSEAAILRSLRVHVVLSEFNGKDKLSSMPYDIPLSVEQNAGAPSASTSWNSIRIGVQVPVPTKGGGESSLDIGTNIDCKLSGMRDGQFILGLTIERSSMHVMELKEGKSQGKDWAEGDPLPTSYPVLRKFRANVTALLRDGQTQESTVATDPITGNVLRVEVTLNVLK